MKSAKSGKSARLGLIVLFLLLILVVTGKFSGIVSSLGSPLSTGIWDGRGRINLVIISPQIYLLSFDPSEKSLLFLKIPDELYVDVPHGFGSWPVGSVYRLGQAEKIPIGEKLLMSTLSLGLGIPVDGYIMTTTPVTPKSFDGLSGLNFIRQSKTNLSFWEYLNLWRGIKSVRFDKIEEVDGGESTLTTSILIPDGSRALALDSVKVDQFVQNKLIDTKLKSEGLSVAIFNSTDHSGLAERASRLITNMGGRVISTGNLSAHLDFSIVSGSSSYTKDRLSRIFAPKCMENKCNQANGNPGTTGTDINIILGEDYYMKYNTK